MRSWFWDSMGPTVLGILAIVAGSVALLSVALIAAIGTGAYFFDRSSCAGYAKQTERPTRFLVTVSALGVPMEWGCFVRSADGGWVDRDLIREVPR